MLGRGANRAYAYFLYPPEAPLFSYRAERQDYYAFAVGKTKLVAGRVRVVFTSGSNRYWRELADDSGAYHRDLDRALPSGIRVLTVNSGGSFVFSARGQAENGTITLTDTRGSARAVQLNQRGHVTILPAAP